MNYHYNSDIRRRVEDCRGRLRRVHRTTTQQTVEQNASVKANEPRDSSTVMSDKEIDRLIRISSYDAEPHIQETASDVNQLKKGTTSEIEANLR